MAGFSFDFLPPETTGGSEQLPAEQIVSSTTPTQQSQAQSQVQPERRPFRWISNLPELLAERAEQEIVFRDVLFSTSTTNTAEQHQRHAEMPAMAAIGEEGGEGEAMTTTAVDPIDLLPLRRVDWETCSFLQAPTAESSATNTAADTSSKEKVWEQSDPDITTGKYEGGMKIWECSLDLVRFLSAQQQQQQTTEEGNNNSNKNGDSDDNGNGNNSSNNSNIMDSWNNLAEGGYVLELGCGHGLPACYLLRQALVHQRRRRQRQQQQQQQGVDGTDDNDNDNDKTSNNQDKPAWTIVFTDYNDFVVQDVTVSNIVINTSAVKIAVPDLVPHVVMGAGDWLDLSRQLQQQQSSSSSSNNNKEEVLSESHTDSSPAVVVEEQPSSQLPPDGKFDWILAAETIYSEQAAQETALFIVRHLTHVTGVALIATKRYYFGVGGGSDVFREALSAAVEIVEHEQHGGEGVGDDTSMQVKVETVRVHDNGTGNIREILSVQLLPQPSTAN
jgi:hypothetical protein